MVFIYLSLFHNPLLGKNCHDGTIKTQLNLKNLEKCKSTYQAATRQTDCNIRDFLVGSHLIYLLFVS